MAPKSADMSVDAEGVAVITLSHAPMNSLHPDLMDALLRAVARAHQSPSVRGIVLVGEGRNFSAGFDIPTFTQVRAPPYHPNDTRSTRIAPFPLRAGGRKTTLIEADIP
jgi:enoyl-CoA hydratase/carnithine racemase